MTYQEKVREKMQALQKKDAPLLLAIESSCDETSAAVICKREIRSLVIASQVETHALYGGVVPEIASRAHVEAICGVVEQALEKAGIAPEDLDGVAVTYGPGLVGALLCGVAFWKSKNLPLTLIAEVFGTGIIGGFAAYPIAKYLMGLTPAAYTVYIVPFLISTVAGSILAGILVAALRKAGVPGLAAKA